MSHSIRHAQKTFMSSKIDFKSRTLFSARSENAHVKEDWPQVSNSTRHAHKTLINLTCQVRMTYRRVFGALRKRTSQYGWQQVSGCVLLGESGSGFLICGVPFEQIHFQISDLSNPLWIWLWIWLWTRIHRITNVRDLKTDHWIINPTCSFGRRIRNLSFCPAMLNFKQVGTSYVDRKDCWQSLNKFCGKHARNSIL